VSSDLDDETRAWILGDLDAIDWRALHSARQGANASAVPDLLTALVNKARTTDDYRRIGRMLEDEIVREGMLSDAAPYVVPYLARWMMAEESEDALATAVDLIETLSECEPAHAEDAPEFAEEQAVLRTALVDAIDAVYAVIATSGDAARRTAIWLAYGIEGLTPRLERAMAAAEAPGADERLRKMIDFVRAERRGGQLGQLGS
jgi:hypothetical protein